MQASAVQWLGRIALVLASLALCALAGEGALRLLSRAQGPVERGGRLKYRFNPYRTDAALGYALRPDWTAVHESAGFRVTVHTNALGLRGGPARTRPSAGTRRLLVVGDSFAFGYGVEDGETFAAQLDAELGPGVEVLNAGVPGYSADHYWVFLRERGFALEPDLVLVAACSNDVGELGWSQLELGEDRLPRRIVSRRWLVDHRGRLRHAALDDAPLPDLPLAALAARSHFANWLRFRLAELWVARAERAQLEADARESAPEGEIAALSPEEIRRGLASGRSFRYRYYRFLMEAIEREAAARGVAVRTLHVGPRRKEASRDCAAAPRTCLDATDLFSRESAPSAFHARDAHWSAEGHRRVARALAAWLRSDPELALGG